MKELEEQFSAPVDVLLTGCYGQVAALVAENLRSHGLSVAEMEYERNDIAFEPWLKKYLDAARPRVVIPVFQADKLSELRHLAGESRFLVDAPEKLHILDDKLECSRLAHRLGIPQPRSYVREAGDGGCELTYDAIENYPVVFKRADGLGGSGVYFPGDRQRLERLLASSRRHLVMDFVQGWDWSVDVLRTSTRFDAVSYKVLEPRGKGFSTKREVCMREDLLEYARRLLDEVDYRGVCGVDFRISDSGEVYFFECNPRFSGGLPSSLEAGVELPWLLYSFF